MTVQLLKYHIPLNEPIFMKGGLVSYREGFLIKTSHGIGELSPLPRFSKENMHEAFVDACHLYKALNLNQSFVPQTASGAMALLMLKFPLIGMPRKQPYKFILGTPQEVYKKITSLYNQGFIEFKIKVGLYNFDQELKLLKILKLSCTSADLIIDANCSLTVNQVQEIFDILGTQLKYLEDPCHTAKEALACHVPLGFDELARFNLATYLEETVANINHIKYVQKPSMNKDLTTNIIPNLLTSYPQDNNKKKMITNLILTSSFETIFGIKYIEQLSTYLNLSTPGTDTLKFFPQDAQDENNFLAKYTQEIII